MGKRSDFQRVLKEGVDTTCGACKKPFRISPDEVISLDEETFAFGYLTLCPHCHATGAGASGPLEVCQAFIAHAEGFLAGYEASKGRQLPKGTLDVIPLSIPGQRLN